MCNNKHNMVEIMTISLTLLNALISNLLRNRLRDRVNAWCTDFNKDINKIIYHFVRYISYLERQKRICHDILIFFMRPLRGGYSVIN